MPPSPIPIWPRTSLPLSALFKRRRRSTSFPGDVHAGDVIGSLVFMQDDNQIAQTNIIAAEDVAAPNFFQGIGVGFDRWIRSIQHQPTVAETQECYYTQALSDR